LIDRSNILGTRHGRIVVHILQQHGAPLHNGTRNMDLKTDRQKYQMHQSRITHNNPIGGNHRIIIDKYWRINSRNAKSVIEQITEPLIVSINVQADVSNVVNQIITFAIVQCFKIFSSWVTRWRCSQ